MSLFYYPDLKSVFIHNPKTGGRSIRLGPLSEFQSFAAASEWHDDWVDVEFCFGFVRHPIDRFMSAYRMLTSGVNRYGGGGSFTTHNLEITDFARRLFDGEGDPNELGTVDGFILHHALPQSDPYYALNRADFIGRFEHYRRDWGAIAERLNISADLPRLNKSSGSKEAPGWLVNDLKRYYANDFDLYCYEFNQ